PTANSTVAIVFLATVTIDNFVLDSLGSAPAVGHGHLRFRVDQGAPVAASADTFTVRLPGPGAHTVFAELRDNLDSLLNPSVMDSLVVVGGAGEPTLSGDLEPILSANCA